MCTSKPHPAAKESLPHPGVVLYRVIVGVASAMVVVVVVALAMPNDHAGTPAIWRAAPTATSFARQALLCLLHVVHVEVDALIVIADAPRGDGRALNGYAVGPRSTDESIVGPLGESWRSAGCRPHVQEALPGARATCVVFEPEGACGELVLHDTCQERPP